MFFRSTRATLLLAGILGLVAAAGLYAGGSSSSREDLDVFTGRIAVKGTEYRLTGDPVEELRAEYQNTIVSVRARLLDSPGAPMPARLEVVSFSGG